MLERIRQSLVATVENVGGTGSRARVEGVVVGGKTGTSQVVRLDRVRGLAPDEIPLRYRDHALFVAFAPAEDPEIVVAVVVEHARGGGGASAAPIAQKVLSTYFEKHPVGGVLPMVVGSDAESVEGIDVASAGEGDES